MFHIIEWFILINEPHSYYSCACAIIFLVMRFYAEIFHDWLIENVVYFVITHLYNIEKWYAKTSNISCTLQSLKKQAEASDIRVLWFKFCWRLFPSPGSSHLASNFKLCFTSHCIFCLPAVCEIPSSLSIFLFRKLHGMDSVTASADFIFHTENSRAAHGWWC